MKKLSIVGMVLLILLVILGIIGEVKCIYKAVKCNWQPVGKAEIVYTVGACTGAGSIIGWINVEDN